MASNSEVIRDNGQRAYVITHARGSLPSLWHKGFCFGDSAPGPVLDSLDGPGDEPPGFAAYRHVVGPWYLVLVRDHEAMQD